MLSSEAFWIDEDDGYFIRSREYMLKVIEYSGLKLLGLAPQVKWPTDAFPIDMYALSK